jgi:hypothetical protein
MPAGDVCFNGLEEPKSFLFGLEAPGTLNSVGIAIANLVDDGIFGRLRPPATVSPSS